jgi:hypothetical protein
MLEAQTVGHAEYIRPALETLSSEQQETLAPYLAARERGEAGAREWPNEVHQIMNVYLKACAEQARLKREAGIPMLSVSETLRRRRVGSSGLAGLGGDPCRPELLPD